MASVIVNRLAKNSFWLYIRSIIVMIIGLFTSRYALQNLGVEDYGIYSVVASIIVFFSFFDGSFSAACLRFYNVEKGRGDIERLKRIFNTSIGILFLLSLFMAICAELLGFYFLDNELQIPEDRMFAARCVFQCSIFTMISNMIGIPFMALIIANEKMTTYAYFDVVVSVSKFVAAFILPFIQHDSLIVYAILILVAQILSQLFSCVYCIFKFPEARLRMNIDINIAKEMGTFSLWVVLNAISSILVFQGLAILYNIYFGVVVNAALGIANQVKSCSLKLTQNLTVSLNPQLTQNYAKGDYTKVNLLFLTGSKLIYSVFSIITLLLLVYTDRILELWLGEVPLYSVGFIRILLINCLMGFVGGMSGALINATGNIKKYQLVNAFIGYLALIAAYASFKVSDNAYMPYIIISFSSLLQSIYNIYLACKAVKFSFMLYASSFTKLVISNIAIVIFGLIIVSSRFGGMYIFNSVALIMSLIFLELLFGYEKDEKKFIFRLIRNLLNLKEIK